MALTMTVPKPGEYGGEGKILYDKGEYVGLCTEVKAERDDGTPFVKTFTDRTTGAVNEREAVVVVWEFVQSLADDEDDAKKLTDLFAEETIGKKLTKSLHEKADLRRYYEIATKSKVNPEDDIDLEDMVGTYSILEIDHSTGENGRPIVPYVKDISKHRGPTPKKSEVPF